MTNCFVIMPFDKRYDPLYQRVIVPSVDECLKGIKSCLRADKNPMAGIIMDKVTHHIINAKLIIAVLGKDNPNVMYELGVAHAFRKPTIILAPKEEDIKLPFDIRHHEAISYSEKDLFEKGESYLADIEKRLRHFLMDFDMNKISDPVVAALPGCKLFIDDVKDWLWGYQKVLQTEIRAKTIWEMGPDSFWFFEEKQIQKAIFESKDPHKKYYIMLPKTKKHEFDKKAFLQALENQKPEAWIDIKRQVQILLVDPDYFEWWPFSVVIFDAGTEPKGIILEPMAHLGADKFDDAARALLDSNPFETIPAEKRWLESTFDIHIDKDKTKDLIVAFQTRWNEEIRRQLREHPEEKEILNEWII